VAALARDKIGFATRYADNLFIGISVKTNHSSIQVYCVGAGSQAREPNDPSFRVLTYGNFTFRAIGLDRFARNA